MIARVEMIWVSLTYPRTMKKLFKTTMGLPPVQALAMMVPVQSTSKAKGVETSPSWKVSSPVTEEGADLTKATWMRAQSMKQANCAQSQTLGKISVTQPRSPKTLCLLWPFRVYMRKKALIRWRADLKARQAQFALRNLQNLLRNFMWMN